MVILFHISQTSIKFYYVIFKTLTQHTFIIHERNQCSYRKWMLEVDFILDFLCRSTDKTLGNYWKL
jgi:hypothetical protein